MADNLQTLTKPAPAGAPSMTETKIPFDYKNSWVLWYRQGKNPHPMFKICTVHGNINDVATRIKRYCERMNLRFLHFDPFFSDLDHEERFINGPEAS